MYPLWMVDIVRHVTKNCEFIRFKCYIEKHSFRDFNNLGSNTHQRAV